MLAVADGGSTKADWRILFDQKPLQSLTTTGFNPNYDSPERMTALLSSDFNQVEGTGQNGTIHYYGTGCWEPGRRQLVAGALRSTFPNARIHVHHDLMGAARATCGDEKGIVCILGTGSSSMLFDGHREADVVPSLGFLLGDEGSGAYIGKHLVRAYFYRDMPVELRQVIESAAPGGKPEIMSKVYSGGVPAAYLAGFTGLFHPHRDHPFIQNLIRQCFQDFIQTQILKYEGVRELPVHFVGSVAYHFRNILAEVLEAEKLNLGKILQKPIEELFAYHLSEWEDADNVS